MPITSDQILDLIIQREGEIFTDNPLDRGGATKYGITQKTLSEYYGYPVDKSLVRNLSKEKAKEVYVALFISKPRYGSIVDMNLRELVIDCAVNHGPVQATKWLQRALGVADDGIIGKNTERAMMGIDPLRVCQRICGQRIKFYFNIVKKDMDQFAFLGGWLNRAVEFLEK